MNALLSYDVVQAGLIILLLLVLGDILSRLLRGAVPAFLIAGMVYMVCCWTNVLPKGLPDLAGFSALLPTVMLILILHMGNSMSVSELVANWRVVTVVFLTYIGQLLLHFLIIGSIFGINIAIGGLPGGSPTALIVQERARAFGYDHIVVLSAMFFATQFLIACPIAGIFVRREAKRLQSLPRKVETSAAEKTHWRMPTPFTASQYGALLRLFLAAWVADRLGSITGISKYVVALILGVILTEVGFLQRRELAGARSDGFLFFLLMGSVLSSFAASTPEMFAQVLVPLTAVLGCELISIFIFSSLSGRLLGFSRPMSIAIGINIMVGFPPNLLLVQDVTRNLSSDPEEQAYLENQIAPKMVIAGLTGLTFLATAGAGILVALMR